MGFEADVTVAGLLSEQVLWCDRCLRKEHYFVGQHPPHLALARTAGHVPVVRLAFVPLGSYCVCCAAVHVLAGGNLGRGQRQCLQPARTMRTADEAARSPNDIDAGLTGTQLYTPGISCGRFETRFVSFTQNLLQVSRALRVSASGISKTFLILASIWHQSGIKGPVQAAYTYIYLRIPAYQAISACDMSSK